LGIKLEETVEQILKKRGYTTEMRQKLEGNSGALNEIDVLAKKQNKVLAVECKNYKESRLVGIKEIRDFESKIQDLPYITDAMFVTNTRFSSEAETYAKHNEIILYGGEKLKNEFYLMSIGMLDSSSASIQQQDIVLEFALPLTMNYKQATRLDLVSKLKLSYKLDLLSTSPRCFLFLVQLNCIE
jgi:Holliday junction resolvase